MSGDETITREELAAYYRRREFSAEWHKPEEVAQIVFEDIKAHREPEYERGQIYEDTTGRRFFRLLGDGTGWSSVPEGTPYTGDYPLRPLRKLVPEGSLAAKLSYEAVLDALARGMDYEEDYTQLAGRIVKLLDGTK